MTTSRGISKPHLWATYPLFKGKVIDPQYVPDEHRHAHEEKWLEWSKSHPTNDWDPFLHKLIAKRAREDMKRQLPMPKNLDQVAKSIPPPVVISEEELQEYDSWAKTTMKELDPPKQVTEQVQMPGMPVNINDEEEWV